VTGVATGVNSHRRRSCLITDHLTPQKIRRQTIMKDSPVISKCTQIVCRWIFVPYHTMRTFTRTSLPDRRLASFGMGTVSQRHSSAPVYGSITADWSAVIDTCSNVSAEECLASANSVKPTNNSRNCPINAVTGSRRTRARSLLVAELTPDTLISVRCTARNTFCV